MQDTRQQILEIIKRHGEATVRELSQELGLTSVTVRHHLEILRSQGYIADPEISRTNKPGRPRFVYRLTSTAADLFPNNYSGLASALLEAVEDCVPPSACQALLELTAKHIAERAGPLPQDPQERVESIVRFLNQQGYVSRWVKDPKHPGRYLIHISSCPYQHVSETHSAPCYIDQHLIEILAGESAVVTRVETKAKDGKLCTYILDYSEDNKGALAEANH